MTKDIVDYKYEFCDNCGDKMPVNESYPMSSLLHSVASANKGESAVLCKECFHKQFEEVNMTKDIDYREWFKTKEERDKMFNNLTKEGGDNNDS